jgi:hypothetical protein
MFKAMGTLAAS